MTVDPQIAALIEAAEAAGSAFAAADVQEARARYAATTAIYGAMATDMRRVRERQMPGPDGHGLAVRIYTPHNIPDGTTPPILAFFHGGGWAMGDLDTHEMICRHVAQGAAIMVVAVDYRLAPEWPFPAGLEDVLAATRWLLANGDSLGGDPARLAVAGDSAGGTFAAAVTHRLRDEGGPQPVFQWLIYPATDFCAVNASREENGQGYLLTADAMDVFQSIYVPDRAAWTDPDVSPLRRSDFSGLPPAFVQTAEYDPLRDEGKAYADALAAAGVAVDYRCYDGMVHGFARMGGIVPAALAALDDGVAALRRAFGT